MRFYYQSFITENYNINFLIIINIRFFTSLTTQNQHGVRCALSNSYLDQAANNTENDLSETKFDDVGTKPVINAQVAKGDSPDQEIDEAPAVNKDDSW